MLQGRIEVLTICVIHNHVISLQSNRHKYLIVITEEMETSIRVISKEKDSITFEMVKYDNTILRPVVEELLKDEQVAEAKYFIKHPIIDNPQIYVKVKTGKPQAAVKRSINKLRKTYENMAADLVKEKKKIEEKR